jgi:hypothetical protein
VGKILDFGHKSGIYWALDPDHGNIVWSTQSVQAVHWEAASGASRRTVSAFMSRSPIERVCPIR